MSTTQRSSGASPSTTHCASTQPAPPPDGDAEGVEAGADEHVGAFGRRAEDEIAVRREAFRPVDHLLDAGGLERRHARHRLRHVLLEMVPIVVEQLELEIVQAHRRSSRPAGSGS